jgi:CRISPR-associated protein Csx10
MDYQLCLELQSAVSPGSGEGWAGVIDSDIVFDEFGLPYIPARRIKGILRENAFDVVSALASCQFNGTFAFGEEEVEILFGKQGQIFSAPLTVDNAYLDELTTLRDWIRWVQQTVPHLATPERVISTFTHLRTQTAINGEEIDLATGLNVGGVAREHTLRVTRALNQGYVKNGVEHDYAFTAAVRIAPEHRPHEMLLALAAQVTRYLGGKRNRGFGKINCRLMRTDTKEEVIPTALAEIESFFN